MHETQQAHLCRADGSIAIVEVAAFPSQPDIVHYADRYFTGGTIGYGVTYLTYSEATYFEATAKATA